MTTRKINKIINYLVLVLIFISSSFLTFQILNKFINVNYSNYIILEKEFYSNPNIYIDWKELSNYLNENDLEEKWNNKDILKKSENKILEIKDNSIYKIENFYKISFKDNEYLLSDDKDSYKYWFISKQVKNKILYLYSHNSYKQTENSGYFFYNNLKLNDVVIFNDNNKYKVVKTDIIEFSEETEKSIIKEEWTSVIYFTCTPYGWNIRKVYQFIAIDE